MNQTGLMSFPLTPFDTDDTVNIDAYVRHLDIQLTAQPAGLFIACGTGEFTALSTDEYRTVVDTAVRVVDGRVPVIAGVGGGPRQARAFADMAAESGADGVLLLPPYLVESTPAGLVGHIRYVAQTSTLPITVYQRANAVLDPASAVALLDIDNVSGIKDGRGDVEAMARIVTTVRTSGHQRAADFEFLNGLPTAELSAHAYRAIGVSNYSSAVLCFAPDIAVGFYRALHAGDGEATARLLTSFYLPFAELRSFAPGYAVALVKAGARLSGLPMGSVRPPLLDPAQEHVERLAEIIASGRAALTMIDDREVAR